MNNRGWTTRIKRIPTANDIYSIICRNRWRRQRQELHAAVISWNILNKVKCRDNKSNGSGSDVVPKWIKDLDKIILETLKLISQSVGEVERLKKNGRMTRKTKRNRRTFESQVGIISETQKLADW